MAKDRTPGGGKEIYETDPEFFACCDAEFQFDLDAAAADENFKVNQYFTKEDDSLVQDWSKYESIWLNPPYSRGVINEFLAKCWATSQEGSNVVVLAHTCTDTKYWIDYVWNKAAEVRHVRGRLKFWLGKECNVSDLPHSLIIYRPRYLGITLQTSWDWKADYLKRIGPLPVRDKNTREIVRYVTDCNTVIE